MRFNGKELAALALQPSHKFDKEGILIVRERQEGLFRRGEVSTEKWCRLRGNMLFYFRSRDQYSEPVGVIILEQYTVHLEPASEDGPYSFTIAFDNDGGTVQFAAASEAERDAWIQALHIASYECMRSQLQTLHSKLNEKIRKSTHEEDASEFLSMSKNRLEMKGEPYLEMSLACDNLMCDGDGQPPNPVVFIYLKKSSQTQWSNYAQTEVIQRSSNPCFLTTVNLFVADLHTFDTQVKFVVYDVRERLTSTMTFLGSAVIANDKLVLREKINLRLPLLSSDLASVGFISISAWQVLPDACQDNGISDSGSIKPATKMLCDEHIIGVRQSPPSRKSSFKSHALHYSNLSPLFDKIISQTYRFHTGLGAELSVHEIMAESKLCFAVPQKIVQLFIKEEKELLHALTSIGNLKDEWSKRQSELLESHLHVINSYTVSLHHMDSYEEAHFKPSSVKNCKNLEFVPVNLHLQRIWVHNGSVKKSGTYDVFTVGAFTAHSRRFRHGGLLRLLNQLKLCTASKSEKLDTISEVVAKIKLLKASLEYEMEQLKRHASNRNGNDMHSTMTAISKASQQLIGVCDSALIDEACGILEEVRITQSAANDMPCDRRIAMDVKSPAHHLIHAKERSKSLDGAYFSSNRLTGCDLEKLSRNARVLIESNLRLVNNRNDESLKASLMPIGVKETAPRITRHESLKDDKAKACEIYLALSERKCDDLPLRKVENVQIANDKKPKKAPCDARTSDLVLFHNAVNESVDSSFLRDCPKEGDNVRNKSPEEAEPWDLTQLNIEASVMCMASKVKSLCKCSSGEPYAKDASQVNFVDELLPSIRKLSQALECLLKTAHFAHVAYLLLEPFQLAAHKRTAQHRRDIIFTQALTTVIVAVMTTLWNSQLDSSFFTCLSKVGLLAQFEGLLSCNGDEMGMLEDMLTAVEDINAVNFKIVKSSNVESPPMPKVEGSRLAMTVSFPCLGTTFNLLPADLAKGDTFKVTAVFFNVGINEQATVAERFGDVSLQDKINSDGFEKLKSYYSRYVQAQITTNKEALSTNSTVQPLFDRLSVHVHARKSKNVDILHLASKICRLLGGLRFTSCKSAKDRTSMSVTLEQCNILQEHYDLAEPEFCRALECMRCEGTRRENALKNAGVRKYAFNSLQIMALPRLYRPPAGTYGNVQT